MREDYSAQLSFLLEEDINSAMKREKETFDDLSKETKNRFVLFGSGALGRKILNTLRKHNIEPIAFSDNNPAKWGGSVNGLQVLSPDEAARKHGANASFIITIWAPRHRYLKTKAQLHKLKCLNIIPFVPIMWKYPDDLLPHYQFSLPSKILQEKKYIEEAFLLLSDDISRSQYISHIRWRLHLDYEGLPTPSFDDQYFPRDIVKIINNELFVDCGAFDGDTIAAFQKMSNSEYKEIIALEPDPANYNKLMSFISTLNMKDQNRIKTMNAAVGARESKVLFDSVGATRASIADHGSIAVNCVTLNNVLRNENPTYIKLDVEGAEYDSLLGCDELIAKKRPKIAICVYHCPDDLWRISILLNKLNPKYNFYLRTHDEDGLEIVLYAMQDIESTLQ
jgi:FkbM family methyltransferase